jgi:hypothetical protein
MRPILLLLVALAPAPVALGAQTAPDSAAAARVPSFRGFPAGLSLAYFTTRARALTRSGATPLLCNTATKTAQVMECGVIMHDPADGAEFYVSGHFIDGRADVVSFGDSGSTDLLTRVQHELTIRYGRPGIVGRGVWKWVFGRQFVALTWRTRGPQRWIFVQLTDMDVMSGIHRYTPPRH